MSFFPFPICFYVKQIHKNLIVNNMIIKCQSFIFVVLNKPPDITDINIIKLFINKLVLLTFHYLVFQLLLYDLLNHQDFLYLDNSLLLLLSFHIHHIHI